MSGESRSTGKGIDTHRIDRFGKRHSRLSELDYLEEEAALAKDELEGSCRRIGRSIKSTAGEVWEKHPVLVSVAAAGLACLGVAWFGRRRQGRTTRTIVTETEATPRGRSLFSRAGGLITKTVISLILARLTAPPADEPAPDADDLSDAEAAA